MRILKLLIFRLVIALILIVSIFPVFTPGADASIVIDRTRTNLTHVSLTIITYPPGGLSFGTHIPGPDKWPEAASPSITITNDGTSDVTIFLKGTDFKSTTANFSVANAFYYDSNNSGSALAMSNSYNSTAWKTLVPGANVTIYHWLTIPAGTPPGTYSSNFTYKAE
jgi:hypothetical protein